MEIVLTAVRQLLIDPYELYCNVPPRLRRSAELAA
jgi:hypothetical protein